MSPELRPPVSAAPGPTMADAAAREEIRRRLDVNMAVEAAAGTGKTTVLVERMVKVLASGLASVDRVVAVTFTEKAAGELKLRLREALERERTRADVAAGQRAHVERALEHLEEAHVTTIHGFCAELLRERPVEAGIDPRFRTLTEADARRLYAQVFDRWLEQRLEHPTEGIRRALRRNASYGSEEGPTDRLGLAGWTLAEWRDFRAPWTRPAFDRRAEINKLVEIVRLFAEVTDRPADPQDFFFQDTRPARQVADRVKNAELAGERERDYDGIESLLVELTRGKFRRPRRGRGAIYRAGVARTAVHDAHERLVEACDAFRRLADADLAALLQLELADTLDRYAVVKQSLGVLDFLDLLMLARDLVRDHDAVRAAFQARFTHIFVDEFQDTDPLQAELLLLLASGDPAERSWRRVRPQVGKLFVVGDPKQSIYRFRRADVGVYQQVRRQLEGSGAACLSLTTSFRAVGRLQRFVNAAFAPLMTGDEERLQASYVPLDPFRTDEPSQPAVIVLPVPDPYWGDRMSTQSINRSFPDAVGAFVDWLVRASGWTVTSREGPSSRVPIEPRHVCLLFRRFDSWGDDVTRPYLNALEARRIPHLLVGGKSFHEREEVDTLRTALAAVEWPDDELSVFGVLHGTLFALGDELLFEYRDRYRRFHPFDRRPDDLPPHLEAVADVLAVLRRLHVGRNYRPVADTIHQLLETTRAHAAFALRPNGEQALANVLHIAELARQYEASGGISFRGFVDRLREDADSAGTSEAPVLEEGTDGVRVMTVHKAKGLEFPVVILADPTARLTPGQPNRHLRAEEGLCAARLAGCAPEDLMAHADEELSRDEAEGVRLAYVAATRARDLLVVPGVGDGPFPDGWTSPLNASIYPPLARRRASEAPAGCPPFGKDSVLQRMMGGVGEATVTPGLHRFRATREAGAPGWDYEVVWWDPNVLQLGAKPLFGLRRDDLIAKGVSDETIDEGRRAYADWEGRKAGALRTGAVPSAAITTVRARAVELAAEAGATLPEVEIVMLDSDDARDGRTAFSGPRLGALVHAVLAASPLDEGSEAVDGVAHVYQRVLGATDGERVEAVRRVVAAWRHPLLARAREADRAGRCRREVPIRLRLGDGGLCEGTVDLAFEERDGWLVVDFKTDRALGLDERVYAFQVALYAEAIAKATNRPARAMLVRI